MRQPIFDLTIRPSLSRQLTTLVAAIVLAAGLATVGPITPVAEAASCNAIDLPQVPEDVPPPDTEAEPDNGRIAGPEMTRTIGEALVNYIVCWNSDNGPAVVSLSTTNRLAEAYGSTDPYQAMETLGTVELPIHVITGDNVRVYEDGRASVDLFYQRGEYGYVDSRWFWVQDGDHWRFDQEVSLPPTVEGDKAYVSYSIADDTSPVVFDQRNTIAAPPVLVLHGTNNGAGPQRLYVYQLPAVPGEGETLEALPEKSVQVACIQIKPGDQVDMALVGLPEGAYGIVSANNEVPAVIVLTKPGE